METYKQTDIYKGMLANPHFGYFTVAGFAVLGSPPR